jgi:NADP-dependent 3-hydroxy acid dehydrogenase YdfG
MKPLVVITGASSGIGAATAKTFSEAGHPLLLVSRRLGKTGTIVNIGSTAGRNIYENHTAYNGTKYAVKAMSESLRREASPHNVRVIMVSPGLVDSELTNGTSNTQILEARGIYRESIGGALQGDDIARGILFAYQQPQNLCVWELVMAPTKQLT